MTTNKKKVRILLSGFPSLLQRHFGVTWGRSSGRSYADDASGAHLVGVCGSQNSQWAVVISVHHTRRRCLGSHSQGGRRRGCESFWGAVFLFSSNIYRICIYRYIIFHQRFERCSFFHFGDNEEYLENSLRLMDESSFFSTGPTLPSFWRRVSRHFFFDYYFNVWIIKECILWWLWVRLCSWLSFCHWWKVNSTDHFSSTLTKLDSVTIMVKENPPAGTSKSLLRHLQIITNVLVVLDPSRMFFWPCLSLSLEGTTVPTL